MTLKPLDFDFPAMSAFSRLPPWQVKLPEQLAELEQEILRRRKAYPLLVDRGRMTGDEAERHIEAFAAIARDIRFEIDCDAMEGAEWDRRHARREAELQRCPFKWDDKVRELRREIALRTNKFPGEIERGRITEAEAAIRMERLDAVHWRYWIELRHFDYPPEFEDEPFSARMAFVRTLAHNRENWLYDQTVAGHPAVRNYLTPQQIAHTAEHRTGHTAIGREQAA